MFVELPNEIILAVAGAFLFGWILASVSASLSASRKARKRDARDDRIRELEAELRIANSEKEEARSKHDAAEETLKETTVGLERRDNVISEQQAKIEKIANDLKESVLKTRELRSDLAERATENVHAEAKIREVETELSVAQASTDMIATGVLDYSFTPEKSDDDVNDSGIGDDLDEVIKASS